MFLASVRTLFSKPLALRIWLRPVSAISMACSLLMANGTAQASSASYQEINQLLESGKIQEASQRVNGYLKQNNGDVQMRFLQGVIAAEQHKYDQAIQIFTALTQEYPGLPEPYNNLAVLYAAKGDERKATQVLEQAIRTNPSYATAHENLGDLYARMASDAYAKALQLDSNRKAVQPKLAIIKQIFPAQVDATRAPVLPTSTATATSNPSTAAVTLPAVGAPIITSTPAATVAVSPPEAKTIPPETVKAVKTPSAAATPADTTHTEAARAVEKAVLAWAKAWEEQNMTAYYAAYSPRFDPQGPTLAEWKIDRKNRIVGKSEINVDMHNLKVTVQGNRASASFRQNYTAGAYKASTRKTLRLQQEGEKWRITREETGR